MRKIRLLPLCVFLLCAPASAQTASLVEDINTTDSEFAAGSSPSELLAAFGKVFFLAGELSSGTEVWVSDGTALGTEMLVDVCPGTCSSSPRFLGKAGGVVFWLAQSRLWRSDGTRAGTFALTALEVRASLPNEPSIPSPIRRPVPILGDTLFFVGCDEARGCELWKSDGSAAGTGPVKDLQPGEEDSYPEELTVAGDKLFFVADDPATFDDALWVSDGTEAGTTVVEALDPRQLTAAGSKLFFFDSVAGGEELWVSDGTAAGTLPVTQFTPQQPFARSWLKAIGGRVYFVANDVVNGFEIWRSDGTPTGTVRVTDFGFYRPVEELQPWQLAEVGGRLVYVATDGITGFKLWATGATPASTTALASLCPGQGNCSYSFLLELIEMGGRVVFLAQDQAGIEPWSTDGTPQGTARLRDTCPGSCGLESRLWAAGGAAYFLGTDQEIWRTNGRAAGTRPYTDLPAEVEFGDALALAVLGQSLFFTADAGGYGPELWTSDGRPGGTRLVADLAHGDPSARPQELVPFGDGVLFTACDGESREVWQSAGTAGNTHPITSPIGYFPDCYPSDGPQVLTRAGNLVFFWRESDLYRPQLWRTDGTPGGTWRLTNFQHSFRYTPRLRAFRGKALFLIEEDRYDEPDVLEIWTSDGTLQGTGKAFDLPAGLDGISSLHAVGDDLYIVGWSLEDGGQIWRSDGTTAGTRRILTGNLQGSEPFQFVRVGSTVFFTAQYSSGAGTGAPLWKTDGTAAGTTLVLHLPGSNDTPSSPTAWQGALYFFASTASFRERALWRSDGTVSGTQVVKAFHSGTPGPSSLTPFGGRLVFTADDGVHGQELWQSDGTAAGTTLVRDIFPGPQGSQPAWLRAVGDRLFFSAGDGVHGFELWQSDGTAAGTRMLQDLAPGPASSHPAEITASGGLLYLSADDGYSGQELWALPLAAGLGCQSSPAALCLGGRFKVEASWRAQGRSGRGTAVGLTADTGYFWFFGADNVEVVIKVLDGQGTNGHHWVFYGALSDVEYALTVTDTQTGAAVRYVNLAGQLASVGDVTGFGRLGAFSTETVDKIAPSSPPALVAERFDPAAIGPCQAGPTRLCLNGGRFAVETAWKALGRSDAGQAVPVTADTGYFWFFDDDNVEVMIKVLDGRGYNSKFWVFYGALSDVEYTVTVTDTQTGKVKTYANPKGRFASVGDTAAF